MISWQEPATNPRAEEIEEAKKILKEQEDKGTAAPVAQKNFRMLHVSQLGHKETQQLGKNGVRRVDKIEKRKVYSPLSRYGLLKYMEFNINLES